MARTSVLVTTEGTYPHYPGGVSVWCDQLIHQMPEVDFHLYSIVHSPGQPLAFELPGNVRSARTVPLWGTPRPAAEETGVAAAFRRRMRTTRSVIRREFLPAFELLLDHVLDPDLPPHGLGDALLRIARYSRRYDYADSMASEDVWQAYLDACRLSGPPLRLRDATNNLRWLQRYLAVAAIPPPQTDIVHSTMAGLAGLPGVIARLEHGTPYLLSEHGLHMREMYANLRRSDFPEASRKFLARFHLAITRLNYAVADRITSLGPFNRRWQVRLGADPLKLVVVPNGVDPNVFEPRPAGKRDRPTVLTMARIFPLKGIEPLMRAVAIVRNRVPNVLFRVLGDVADEGYFRQCQQVIADLRIERNVEFGVTGQPHLAYRDADVCCLPSLSEGMPYVVIEAMMSGCPVVATEVGNVKETLGHCGLLVHPNNPEELAAALLQLLDGAGAPDFRHYLAVAGLQRARRLFTLDKCAVSFRRIYKEVRHGKTAAVLSRATG